MKRFGLSYKRSGWRMSEDSDTGVGGGRAAAGEPHHEAIVPHPLPY